MIAGIWYDSIYRVAGNRTTGEASANRAVNTVTAQTVNGVLSAGLTNTQINAATTQVSATGSAAVPLGSSGTGFDVTVRDNAVSALARGNAVENNIDLSSNAAMPGIVGRAMADRFGTEAAGGATLVNSQANYTPVAASAADTSLLVPLNAGTVDGSRFTVSGNSVSATAYGNAASNSISVSGLFAPPAVIANNQVNSGNVTAIATGARDGGAASLGASNFTMSGNQISTMAVGNQVSSAITGLR